MSPKPSNQVQKATLHNVEKRSEDPPPRHHGSATRRASGIADPCTPSTDICRVTCTSPIPSPYLSHWVSVHEHPHLFPRTIKGHPSQIFPTDLDLHPSQTSSISRPCRLTDQIIVINATSLSGYFFQIDGVDEVGARYAMTVPTSPLASKLGTSSGLSWHYPTVISMEACIWHWIRGGSFRYRILRAAAVASRRFLPQTTHVPY